MNNAATSAKAIPLRAKFRTMPRPVSNTRCCPPISTTVHAAFRIGSGRGPPVPSAMTLTRQPLGGHLSLVADDQAGLRQPLRSANNTVTCLRSPLRAVLDVRIRSAKCFGVYDPGEANRAPRWRRRSRRQCHAAAIAELAPGLYLRTAARANRRECRAALATETGTVPVVCLVPGTLHAGASEHSGWSER